MNVLLDHRTQTQTAPDEQPARRALRAQVARLEEERAGLVCSAWPRTDLLPGPSPAAGTGARSLSIGELEALRDRLERELRQARRALAKRTAAEEESRRLREEMLLNPERHRGTVVTNADMGEPGCTRFQARPRFGLLGMLMSWWRVVVSSGCP
ncbi:MAG: hypothetical protein ABR581_03790 [Thermoleophilaceae bacterium]